MFLIIRNRKCCERRESKQTEECVGGRKRQYCLFLSSTVSFFSNMKIGNCADKCADASVNNIWNSSDELFVGCFTILRFCDLEHTLVQASIHLELSCIRTARLWLHECLLEAHQGAATGERQERRISNGVSFLHTLTQFALQTTMGKQKRKLSIAQVFSWRSAEEKPLCKVPESQNRNIGFSLENH